ncbi:hypothetical protein [Vibrio sp. SCSIO 43136]|uniref:hypothetical protein n=1 Tax=Vibrio sp. SCSIO 43136 TaxID=2819101 RepID=UPI002075A1C3|nr:hypothetical protein [Vibrio sp. SCSIO 43136]USD63969.1 hypothetical protein J4N39_07460 [Vibrio sp. SCSIO 43136]
MGNNQVNGINIYLPCSPDWICDGLIYFFLTLFGIVIVAMVILVIKEKRRIDRRSNSRRGSMGKKH